MNKTNRMLFGLIFTVLGVMIAAASTVLAAIETDWLNVNVNADSGHPCRFKESETPLLPSSVDCTAIEAFITPMTDN